MNAVGWSLAILLALVALLRLVAWDTWEPLAVLNALTIILYLPAWVIAIGAVLGRRWWLTAIACLPVVAQVVFLAPEYTASTPLPAWAARAEAVRLVDANVDKDLRFPRTYLEAIRRNRPDLVLLEELTPDAARAAVRGGVFAPYPYRCGLPAYGAVGLLIASKMRLTGCRIRSDSIEPLPAAYLVEATAWLPSGPVKLRLVHTIAPLPKYWHHWTAEMAALAPMVRRDGPTRMLVVGDFNATWGNRSFRTILQEGLVDGAAARGEALDMTWPNGAVVPPFARIDHVLTGPGLATTSIRSQTGAGSDHRFLLSTIAVRRASQDAGT